MTSEDARSVSGSPRRDIEPFVQELLAICPMIRSLWLVAALPERVAAVVPYTWDLVALADSLTLHRLRRTVKLHRADVRLRVLTHERLENAWGGTEVHGAPLAQDWRRTAVCLWQGVEPMRGPHS